MKKNDQKHLPLYGVGPLYGSIIMLMSAISVILPGNKDSLYWHSSIFGYSIYCDRNFIDYAWDIYMDKEARILNE